MTWAQVERAPSKYTNSQKAFAFGTAMHLVLERYYTGGRPDWTSEPGRAALRGLTLAPHPEELLEVRPEHDIEGEIDMRRLVRRPKWSFVGRTDLHGLVSRDGLRRMGYRRASEPAWMVLDWKSSVDPEQYAVPRAKLRVEPQGVIYPLALMHAEGLDAVGARWVYFPKKPRSRPNHTSFVQTAERAEVQAMRLYAVGNQLLEYARDRVDPNDLPKNTSKCDEYGGCPFRAECQPKRGTGARLVALRRSKHHRPRCGQKKEA